MLITEPSRARSAAEFEVRWLSGCAVSIDNGALQPRVPATRSGNPAADASAGVEFQAPEGQRGSGLSLLYRGHEGFTDARHITVSRRPWCGAYGRLCQVLLPVETLQKKTGLSPHLPLLSVPRNITPSLRGWVPVIARFSPPNIPPRINYQILRSLRRENHVNSKFIHVIYRRFTFNIWNSLVFMDVKYYFYLKISTKGSGY